MSKRRRVCETLKDLLIAALICSALWLVTESQLFGQLGGVLEPAVQNEGTAGGQTAGQSDLIRPLRMAVMTQGGCRGVQYAQEEGETLFNRVAPLLGEALSAAGTPEAIDRESWESALLTAPGIYFDFQGAIPMQVLTGWLSGAERPELTATVRHLLLSGGEGAGVELCFRDERDGQFYRCRAESVNADYLRGAAEQTAPNGASFAYQSGTWADLDPDTLLSAQTPEPRTFAAADPLEQDESRLDALLETLSFPAGITTVYETPEGRRVRSGNDTLTISNAGVISYQSAEERYTVPASEGNSPLFCAVDGARALACAVLEPWCGDARVYLAAVEERGDGCWWVEFGYALDDTPVQTGALGYAAGVLVEHGVITEFAMQLRTYSALDETTVLLPEKQAAAILAQQGPAGSRLQLCYRDSGETVKAGWIAG